MTREERAIQILEQRACCRECVVTNCTCAECDEAFDMAIKALEQEPILDKVRAEIEAYTDLQGFITISEGRFGNIFDKYKAETEET